MHFHTALDYTNCIPCVQYTETVSNVVIGYRLVAEWSCINTRKSHGSGDPSSSITREKKVSKQPFPHLTETFSTVVIKYDDSAFWVPDTNVHSFRGGLPPFPNQYPTTSLWALVGSVLVMLRADCVSQVALVYTAKCWVKIECRMGSVVFRNFFPALKRLGLWEEIHLFPPKCTKFFYCGTPLRNCPTACWSN